MYSWKALVEDGFEWPAEGVRTFKAGDVVSLPTDHLLESKSNLISMMGHHTRQRIYGVVNRDPYQSGDTYSIHWSIHGLFNMDDDEVSEIQSKETHFLYLKLVRKNDNADEGDDEYLKKYFEHDGSNWKLRTIDVACDGCGETQWFYCWRSKKETRCRRAQVLTQIPMLQLYLDLEMDINEHMTMAQKRFTCFRFYTKVVQNELTFGETRSVSQCVCDEIERRFPRQEGVGVIHCHSGD